jgi:hypothetical protein
LNENPGIVEDTARDETAPAAFGEDALRLYLGRNAGPYVDFWERARASGHPFVWSWNWWGLLFPLPWLFYRKLWSVGAAVVLLPVLLDALIGLGTKLGLLLAALVAAGGKPLVVERAERKTRTIDALGLVSQDSIERLRRSGGVSHPGAVIGALFMVALLGLAIYDDLPVRLPGCAELMVRETVIDIARDNPGVTGLEARNLRLEKIRQAAVIGEGHGRLCHAELRGAGQSLPVEYDLLWRARDEGSFVVDLRVRRD